MSKLEQALDSMDQLVELVADDLLEEELKVVRERWPEIKERIDELLKKKSRSDRVNRLLDYIDFDRYKMN